MTEVPKMVGGVIRAQSSRFGCALICFCGVRSGEEPRDIPMIPNTVRIMYLEIVEKTRTKLYLNNMLYIALLSEAASVLVICEPHNAEM
jgi:hypothetical protein